MKRSLRKTLADSNIAAVSIAVLLLWSFIGISQVLADALSRAASYLYSAVTIFDMPHFSSTLTREGHFGLNIAVMYLWDAVMSIAAAWLLSHWVYGAGPFRSLSQCRARLTRRNHA
ncbi:MAG: hypothetical protein ABSG25_02270 [Bryobacteraceae bacterium]